MRIVSYTSQTFASTSEIFAYLAANVPWWDSTENDILTVDNITVELVSSALKFTETHSGRNFSTGTTILSSSPSYVLITDTAVIIGYPSSSSTQRDSIIIGLSTDGTNEHYSVVHMTYTGAIRTLTYGAMSTNSYTIPRQQSVYNMQIYPIIATETKYKIKDAYVVLMETDTTFNGKFELNNEKYVQGGGLALKYTE